MCELLIVYSGQINSDPVMDCQVLKAGDVITIQEDGWPWGVGELTNPNWRVFRVAGTPAASAFAFLGPEVDSDPANPNMFKRQRAFSLELTNPALPADAAGWLADNSRSLPIYTAALTFAQLMSLKMSKIPL